VVSVERAFIIVGRCCPYRDSRRAEVGRVGANAEKMLSGFRAGAARDREKLRADPGAQGAQP
jgi:hypothetical protein